VPQDRNVVNPGIGRLASRGKRRGAYFLDLLVPLVPLFLILVVAVGVGAAATEGLFLSLFVFVPHTIWAFVLFARGTTPGKKLRDIVKSCGSGS
jgi:hypothetical protein